MRDQTLRRLENKGLLILDDQPCPAEATLIVVGVARGGTSLVAGVLHSLGLFLGDQSHAPVYEDVQLSSAFEDDDQGRIGEVVASYNDRYPRWGWKRPASVHYLDKVHKSLRNPRYLIVFKDAFSIANRNRISMSSELVPGIRRTLKEYDKILDFLERHRPPALLISYDKALRNPDEFVESVTGFCGLSPGPEQIDTAISFVTPNPTAYLEATRADRVVGHLDQVTPLEVAGWAATAIAKPDSEPLAVQLWINDVLHSTVVADQYRADLERAGVHPTGRAAFRFRFPQQGSPRPGDVVRVFAGPERTELKNSPWAIETVDVASKVPCAQFGQRPLVFLHIPKTAGTSLRSLLEKHMHAESLVSLDPPFTAEDAGQVSARMSVASVLLGHLFFGIDEELGFRGDYATFVRDPVDRVLSFWKHQQVYAQSKFHAEAKSGMSLREFVDSGLTLQTDNHMTRILVGNSAPGMLDGSIKCIDDPRYLEIALNNVRERFRFVGFVEYFDQSVHRLFEVMGRSVEPQLGRRLNAIKDSAKGPDPADLEAVLRHNVLDMVLYRELISQANWLEGVRPFGRG